MLLYPVWPKETEEPEPVCPTMGFALLPPQNDLPRQAQFTVRVKKFESEPVVDISAAEVA